MRFRQASAVLLRSILMPVVAFATFAACQSVLDPPLPEGTRQFTPPPVFNVWWSMASECSSRTGELSDVEWFIVPGVSEFEHQGGTSAATGRG